MYYICTVLNGRGRVKDAARARVRFVILFLKRAAAYIRRAHFNILSAAVRTQPSQSYYYTCVCIHARTHHRCTGRQPINSTPPSYIIRRAYNCCMRKLRRSAKEKCLLLTPFLYSADLLSIIIFVR